MVTPYDQDIWGSIAFVEESNLPPTMPNRRKFRAKLCMDQQLRKAISRQQLKDAVASTILKIRFAKEAFHQLSKIDLDFSARLLRLESPHEVNIRINLKNYYRLVRELDSFMFELYGSFDYFSKEIDLVLGLGLKDPYCSFGQVKQVLEKRGGDDDLRRVTLKVWQSEWFEYIRKLRHRLTHRNGIIVCFSNNELYFPDDPLSEPESTYKRMKVIPTCHLWLEQSMGYIEEATGYLGERVFPEW